MSIRVALDTTELPLEWIQALYYSKKVPVNIFFLFPSEKRQCTRFSIPPTHTHRQTWTTYIYFHVIHTGNYNTFLQCRFQFFNPYTVNTDLKKLKYGQFMWVGGMPCHVIWGKNKRMTRTKGPSSRGTKHKAKGFAMRNVRKKKLSAHGHTYHITIKRNIERLFQMQAIT